MLSLRFKPSFTKFLQEVEITQSYGWEPDPDDFRDEEHEFETTPANKNYSSAVGVIDNTKFFKDISSQFHLPSCTANGGADLIEAVDIHHKVQAKLSTMNEEKALAEAKAEVPDLSRMFLWWNGRNEMDPPRIHDIESGCYNRLIMDIASRFGVCREDLWPYNEDILPPKFQKRPVVRPSLTAYRNARGHMTKSYHAIMDDGDKRLEKVVKALQATPGVLFGTALGPDFGKCGGNVVMRPTTTRGRHAMIIVGYDRNKRAFLVRNSWGKEFGIDGYFWMHESYVAWRGTRSLWVCTKGVLS